MSIPIMITVAVLTFLEHGTGKVRKVEVASVERLVQQAFYCDVYVAGETKPIQAEAKCSEIVQTLNKN